MMDEEREKLLKAAEAMKRVRQAAEALSRELEEEEEEEETSPGA